MSAIYCPDCWVMLKISGPDKPPMYKILASWYGGYGGSNRWKLSSGTTNVTKTDSGAMLFKQASGSEYMCGKPDGSYGMSGYTAGVFNTWNVEGTGITIEIMPENTDFTSIKYE